jgi:caa(3)-type oxidase subunit IV
METTRAAEPSMRLYVSVWLGLIVIVAVEVGLTFLHWPTPMLLIVLLALAIAEAAIALRYFMHLKYENPALFWTLVPAVVFALLMMNQLWPDAFRLRALRFPPT